MRNGEEMTYKNECNYVPSEVDDCDRLISGAEAILLDAVMQIDKDRCKRCQIKDKRLCYSNDECCPAYRKHLLDVTMQPGHISSEHLAIYRHARGIA